MALPLSQLIQMIQKSPSSGNLSADELELMRRRAIEIGSQLDDRSLNVFLANNPLDNQTINLIQRMRANNPVPTGGSVAGNLSEEEYAKMIENAMRMRGDTIINTAPTGGSVNEQPLPPMGSQEAPDAEFLNELIRRGLLSPAGGQ